MPIVITDYEAPRHRLACDTWMEHLSRARGVNAKARRGNANMRITVAFTALGCFTLAHETTITTCYLAIAICGISARCLAACHRANTSSTTFRLWFTTVAVSSLSMLFSWQPCAEGGTTSCSGHLTSNTGAQIIAD